ncbi:hypothetical protein BGX26_007228, partial [Mortierella sp. AD094]
ESDQLPEESDQLPEESDQLPEELDQPPEESDQLPEVSNQPPEVSSHLLPLPSEKLNDHLPLENETTSTGSLNIWSKQVNRTLTRPGSVSSNSSLGSRAISTMRREFSFGFESYDGLPWTLLSGTSIDEVILEITQCLKFETPLHSFIIDDRLESMILECLPNDADKSEFQTFINDTDNKEYGFELPEWMALEMSRFDLDPNGLFDVLSKDWSNLDTGTIPQ